MASTSQAAADQHQEGGGGELLALPAPEPGAPQIKLNVATGEPVSLDHLGPVIVTTTGALERISNWDTLSEREQQVSWFGPDPTVGQDPTFGQARGDKVIMLLLWSRVQCGKCNCCCAHVHSYRCQSLVLLHVAWPADWISKNSSHHCHSSLFLS
jgi:hypothetical protein